MTEEDGGMLFRPSLTKTEKPKQTRSEEGGMLYRPPTLKEEVGRSIGEKTQEVKAKAREVGAKAWQKAKETQEKTGQVWKEEVSPTLRDTRDALTEEVIGRAQELDEKVREAQARREEEKERAVPVEEGKQREALIKHYKTSLREENGISRISDTFLAAEKLVEELDQPGKVNALIATMDALHRQAGEKEGYKPDVPENLSEGERVAYVAERVKKDFEGVEGKLVNHFLKDFNKAEEEFKKVEEEVRQAIADGKLPRREVRRMGYRLQNARNEYLNEALRCAKKAGGKKEGRYLARGVKQSFENQWKYEEVRGGNFGMGSLGGEFASERKGQAADSFRRKLTEDQDERNRGFFYGMGEEDQNNLFSNVAALNYHIEIGQENLQRALNAEPYKLCFAYDRLKKLQAKRERELGRVRIKLAEKRVASAKQKSKDAWANWGVAGGKETGKAVLQANKEKWLARLDALKEKSSDKLKPVVDGLKRDVDQLLEDPAIAAEAISNYTVKPMEKIIQAADRSRKEVWKWAVEADAKSDAEKDRKMLELNGKYLRSRHALDRAWRERLLKMGAPVRRLGALGATEIGTRLARTGTEVRGEKHKEARGVKNEELQDAVNGVRNKLFSNDLLRRINLVSTVTEEPTPSEGTRSQEPRHQDERRPSSRPGREERGARAVNYLRSQMRRYLDAKKRKLELSRDGQERVVGGQPRHTQEQLSEIDRLIGEMREVHQVFWETCSSRAEEGGLFYQAFGPIDRETLNSRGISKEDDQYMLMQSTIDLIKNMMAYYGEGSVSDKIISDYFQETKRRYGGAKVSEAQFVAAFKNGGVLPSERGERRERCERVGGMFGERLEAVREQIEGKEVFEPSKIREGAIYAVPTRTVGENHDERHLYYVVPGQGEQAGKFILRREIVNENLDRIKEVIGGEKTGLETEQNSLFEAMASINRELTHEVEEQGREVSILNLPPPEPELVFESVDRVEKAAEERRKKEGNKQRAREQRRKSRLERFGETAPTSEVKEEVAPSPAPPVTPEPETTQPKPPSGTEGETPRPQTEMERLLHEFNIAKKRVQNAEGELKLATDKNRKKLEDQRDLAYQELGLAKNALDAHRVREGGKREGVGEQSPKPQPLETQADRATRWGLTKEDLVSAQEEIKRAQALSEELTREARKREREVPTPPPKKPESPRPPEPVEVEVGRASVGETKEMEEEEQTPEQRLDTLIRSVETRIKGRREDIEEDQAEGRNVEEQERLLRDQEQILEQLRTTRQSGSEDEQNRLLEQAEAEEASRAQIVHLVEGVRGSEEKKPELERAMQEYQELLNRRQPVEERVKEEVEEVAPPPAEKAPQPTETVESEAVEPEAPLEALELDEEEAIKRAEARIRERTVSPERLREGAKYYELISGKRDSSLPPSFVETDYILYYWDGKNVYRQEVGEGINSDYHPDPVEQVEVTDLNEARQYIDDLINENDRDRFSNTLRRNIPVVEERGTLVAHGSDYQRSLEQITRDEQRYEYERQMGELNQARLRADIEASGRMIKRIKDSIQLNKAALERLEQFQEQLNSTTEATLEWARDDTKLQEVGKQIEELKTGLEEMQRKYGIENEVEEKLDSEPRE